MTKIQIALLILDALLLLHGRYFKRAMKEWRELVASIKALGASGFSIEAIKEVWNEADDVVDIAIEAGEALYRDYLKNR